VLELLLPHRDRNAVHLLTLSNYGPIARVLGRLSARLGRLDEAREHFEHALSVADRSRTRAWRCVTLVDYAATLRRASLGPRPLWQALAEEAMAEAERIGAMAVSARARTLIGELRNGP
jgi:tetratricopeptide (TPR) repeat protein